MSGHAAVLLVTLLGSLSARALEAQGTQPFRKSDLVRLLTAGRLDKTEVASLVRRNCVTFRATERDRADLRALGADQLILAAMDECTRARGAARGPATVGVLRVVSRPKLSAEAGTELNVTLQLLRGGTPRAGAPVLLRGSGAIPGGLGHDAQAVTNQRGVAILRVAAGTTAATYRLVVALANGQEVTAGGVIDLTTTPARALRASATPATLRVWEGHRGGDSVTVVVTDVYGNAVSALPLELRPVTADLAGLVPRGTADERGRVAFALTAGSVRRGGEVGVFAASMQIATFAVYTERPVLSTARTRFTAGGDQRGAAGTTLPQWLILEVRDTSGAAAPGESVTFRAAGGSVAPATALTDTSGTVRVRLTVGTRAGPVLVIAKVDTLTRSVTAYADPGPAHELQVFRGDSAVTGRLVVRSRVPVSLRVVARDAYGNQVPLTKFVAVANGPAVRLRSASAAATQALVTLEPRRGGVGEAHITASGLERTVPLDVRLAVLAEGWVFGARGSWAGFSYSYQPLPYIQGRPGIRGELFLGRAITSHLRLDLAGSVGSLTADSSTREVSVGLMQGYVRGEYALLREGAVIPVVSAGGGLFRIKSNDPRHFVWHTSFFWLAGVGFDARLSKAAVFEVRAETQQLNEMSSRYVNGHVGSLTVVEAGVRFSP